MEETFALVADQIALGIEAAAVLIVLAGAIRALVRLLPALVSTSSHQGKKEIWRSFGGWLLLGLEFELAADIIRSTIAPGWMEIAQLGAIAVIRTFLNYFLEADLDHAERVHGVAPGAE